jgi:hypothetical protein
MLHNARMKPMRLIFRGLISSILLMAPLAPASAAIVPACMGSGCRACDLVTLAQSVINFLIIMSIPLAVLVVALAGFRMVIRGQGSEILSNLVTSVTIGILIALGSWLVIDMFMKALVDGGKFGPWNKIECVENPIFKDLGVTSPTGLTPSGDISRLPEVPVAAGDCTASALESTWGANAARFSCIIAGESSCRNTVTQNGVTVPLGSGTDLMQNGEAFSFGMYQINITANSIRCNDGRTLNCPSAFDKHPVCATNPRARECLGYGATIRDRALYTECAAAAANPNCNTPTAQDIFRRQGFGAWGADARGNCSRF